MKTIIGIETSCDETAVAVLIKEKNKLKIKSNIVSSQAKLHAKYGGVFPYLAKREHQKNLPIVFNSALKKTKKEKIDLICVTAGPGLEPCLWVGINFAKKISQKLKKPIIPVNHIEGHIFSALLGKSEKYIFDEKKFPKIALIVSGGHTQIILIKNFFDYQILGETRDDAAGECFDKTARILKLGYPGGPLIEKMAKLRLKKNEIHNQINIKLPRPMMYQKNYDFSFSGLKTAVLYSYNKTPEKIRKTKIYIKKMAEEIQQAVIDVLIYKTIKAAKEYKAKTIILGGGVAANQELRKQMKNICLKENIELLISPKNLCTDNAAMIAAAGYYRWLKQKPENLNIEADSNLRIK
jgi:N6-L-threonylcarbamoyladenine synthase